MSNLPPDLLLEILVRLPPKDLLRCTSVSNAWYALIHDQHFVKAHLRRSTKTKSAPAILLKPFKLDFPQSDFSLSTFNDDETFGAPMKIEQPFKFRRDFTQLLGYSVDGLVCIYNLDDGDIALWNPSIQKCKKIPFPTVDSGMKKLGAVRYGFGYDSVNDDYKILRIMEVVTVDNFDSWDSSVVRSQVQIYSLKSNSWKMIQNMPCIGFQLVYQSHVVFLNGALSWLMRAKLDTNKLYTSPYIIQTLDLASEQYQTFPTPVCGGNSEVILAVLEEYLCFCVYHFMTRNDVWVMKRYGVTESWTLRYSVVQKAVPLSFYSNCTPLAFLKNGEMVLSKDGTRMLFWFDLERKIVEQVEIHGMPPDFQTAMCVGSLCLLDGDSVIV